MRLETKIAVDRWVGGALVRLLNAAAWALGRVLSRDHSLDRARVIVVCKLMGLGSIIQATPLLRALTTAFPEARLVLLTRHENGLLCRRLDLVSETLTIDDHGLLSLVRSLARVLVTLWRLRVDLFLNLEVYSHLGSLLTVASCARNRVGLYLQARDVKATGIYTDMVYFNRGAPISEVYLQLARAVGAHVEDRRLARLVVLDDDRARLRAQLDAAGLPPGAPYLVVNPNASELRLERRWPADRFAALLSSLLAEAPSLTACLVGTPAERAHTAAVREAVEVRSRARVLDLAGRLDLAELFALVEGARLVLTNDSGPMHVAFSLDTPTVSLFGPVAPEHYSMRGGNRHFDLYRRVYCSPCVHHFERAPCDGDNQCLKLITVEEVLGVVRSVLSAGSPSGPPPFEPFFYEKADVVFGALHRPRDPRLSCPVCGDRDQRRLARRAGHEACRCAACGLEYLHPQPSQEALQAIYGRRYYDAWGLGEDEEEVRRLKLATFHRRLDLVGREIPAGASVLDLGCATGFFLEAAASRGYEPFGVEISAYGARICRERFGAGRVFEGELQQATFSDNPANRFDAIFMSDFLEHVRDPREVLAAARERLRPRGWLVVTTPWTGSLSHRLLGAAWPHYKAEHLFYFGERSLRRLLEVRGFAPPELHRAPKRLSLAYLRHHARVHAPASLPGRLLAHLPRALLGVRLWLALGERTAVSRRLE